MGTTRELLHRVAQIIYSKKGSDVVAIDVTVLGGMTDYFLIASGNVDRHLKALTYEVERYLAEEGWRPRAVEGKGKDDWVALDYVDFVVHLFTPSERAKYCLEQLWEEGKVIPFAMSCSGAGELYG